MITHGLPTVGATPKDSSISGNVSALSCHILLLIMTSRPSNRGGRENPN